MVLKMLDWKIQPNLTTPPNGSNWIVFTTQVMSSMQGSWPGKIIFVYLPPRIKAALPKAAMVEAWVSLKLRALVLSLVRDSTAEPP